jgi:hypothetical protein
VPGSRGRRSTRGKASRSNSDASEPVSRASVARLANVMGPVPRRGAAAPDGVPAKANAKSGSEITRPAGSNRFRFFIRFGVCFCGSVQAARHRPHHIRHRGSRESARPLYDKSCQATLAKSKGGRVGAGAAPLGTLPKKRLPNRIKKRNLSERSELFRFPVRQPLLREPRRGSVCGAAPAPTRSPPSTPRTQSINSQAAIACLCSNASNSCGATASENRNPCP